MSELTYKDNVKLKAYLKRKYRNRHIRRRNAVLKLLGGACVDCGNNDLRVQQIDHTQPILLSSKRRTLTQMFPSILRGDEPINNLQLLCANCHMIKTVNERSL
ncbi:HNH endonuclease [Candidatus Saccharibacteria bacterium]|nr:HNH endonuclease [Candidatus Saccharibacteria bacterium]